MQRNALPMDVVLLGPASCSADFWSPEFSPIEYLLQRTPAATAVPVATLREAGTCRATTGGWQTHPASRQVNGPSSRPLR